MNALQNLFFCLFVCVCWDIQDNIAVLKYKNVPTVTFLFPAWLQIENQPIMFCCSKRWLVTLNGPEPVSAVQLSEAVVGGWVPWRLAQQAVWGVFSYFDVPGNSCDLGVQGKTVAVKTVWDCRVA